MFFVNRFLSDDNNGVENVPVSTSVDFTIFEDIGDVLEWTSMRRFFLYFPSVQEN